jgi:hypothetical protein
VAIGYAVGGRLSTLAGLRLRGVWLLWAAAALALAARRLLPDPAAAVAAVAAFALAATCLARNLRRSPAVAISGAAVLTGALLNAAAFLANGAMPYSPGAADAAGFTPDPAATSVAASARTRLAFLGDILPVPPLQAVVSLGDVVIACGVVALTAALMRGTPAAGRAAVPRAGEEVSR